jgi:tRNA (cytosine34-C5)-methyltransferase
MSRVSSRSFFGVEGLDPTILLSRSREARKKNVYLTSASVKDFLTNNEENIKVINTGIKVFIRCDGKNSSCEFRIAQEVRLLWIVHFHADDVGFHEFGDFFSFNGRVLRRS